MIRDVMDVFLVEMELDGFVQEAKDRWMGLPATTNHSCVGAEGEEASDTEPLGLVRFEGIFEILFAFIVICLAWHFIAKNLAANAPEEAPEEPQAVHASIGHGHEHKHGLGLGHGHGHGHGHEHGAHTATGLEPRLARMEGSVSALEARVTEVQSGIEKVREQGRVTRARLLCRLAGYHLSLGRFRLE